MAVLGKGLSHVLGRVKQNVQDCVTRLKTACDIKLIGYLVLKISISQFEFMATANDRDYKKRSCKQRITVVPQTE